MFFENGKKYYGYTDNFLIEMMPKESVRNYTGKGIVKVRTWHVRITEDGLSKKQDTPRVEKSILELLRVSGYSFDDLTWVSEKVGSTKGNPWIKDIETGERYNCIYFILAIGADRVKIGWARDLRSRLDCFSTASPYPLTVLHSIPARREDERPYHRKFSHIRIHGEWFSYTDELKEFIESLKK